ncbi:MAG: NAD(P)-dependent alcohol dehydrogenase [Gammaproteobacteria bacterium]|nr:NAD(P)-dependent alcohol dehydrogenase [Gammaproteobacteria bacterium]
MRTPAAIMEQRGGAWRIDDLEVAAPGPGEVQVRVVASGICQTDVHARDGFFESLPWPAVYGHEGAGVVVAVGPGVTGLREGDPVIMASPSCGECTECRAGYECYCLHSQRLKQSGRRIDGTLAFERAGVPLCGSFFQQSSFATTTLATGRNTIKVPDDLPLDVLAAFPCGVNTGAGAVMNTLKPVAGDSFVVFGVGTVGCAALMAARLAGCEPIVAVDLHEPRLELARELGASHTFDARAPELVERIRESVDGGARFALEAAGFPESLRAAIEVLGPRGTACLVGSAAPGVEVSVEMKRIQRGRRVCGCVQGESQVQHFLPELIELYRQGQLPVDRLVRHYELADINEAVADMLSGRTIKPVLRMPAP